MSRLFCLCLALLFCQFAFGQTKLPTPLEDWTSWVLEKHTDRNCPVLYNKDEKYCIWPSKLSIRVAATGGEFEQLIEVFSESWVRLPGDQQIWPLSVVDLNRNQALIVRENQTVPEVFLSPGQYRIQGKWVWNAMPRTLTVPTNTGIISLAIDNKIINSPFLESPTQLLLNATKQSSDIEDQDNVQVRVFRQLQDDIPLKMLTRIELDISGKDRELHLGQALTENFQLLWFNSDLPARIEKDGSLRLQAKAGSFVISMQSQSQKPVTRMGFNKIDGLLWPDQEVWVFAQKPELRSVQISGAASIDPQQTLLPEEWRHLPAYLLDDNNRLVIDELQRGGETSKNQLSLTRKMWLDFSGKGYTVKDTIRGELHQGWRLETNSPFVLKSAKADGQAQLITRLADNSNSGIEIRQRRLNVEAISRVDNSGELPVSGWSSMFNNVSTELILPPGWSLIAATGTSHERGSWIQKWTLWNLFLVLILAVAIGKIIHPATGLLALLTLVLIFHRADSPVWSWLNLITVLAILPFISGKIRQWVVRYLAVSFIATALLLLPFAVQQAREFFYPQQEYPGKNMSNEYYYAGSSNSPFAATSPAPLQETLEAADLSVGAADWSLGAEKPIPGLRKKMQTQKIQQYDPNQVLQTGPGIPEWNWNSVNLQWSGPVVSEEITRFYLVSPFWSRLGNLLACILSLALLGFLLKYFVHLLKTEKKPDAETRIDPAVNSALVMIIGLVIGLSPLSSGNLSANAFPDEKLLQELESRLTTPAKCLPYCASIEAAHIRTSSDRLWLNLTVHAADKIALPLPGQASHWWPDTVTVNDKPASLLQNFQGQLFVFLPQGKHKIMVSASLDSRESIDINFGMAVHQFSSQLEAWQINGNTQGVIQSVQLQPAIPSINTRRDEQLRPDPVAPFVIVRRSFNFDLEWSLQTEVIRVAPVEGVINLEIPLLPGESPLSGNTPLQNLSADKQKLQIRLDKQQSGVNWTSRLEISESIKLTAAEGQPWIEVWEVHSSPVWHLQTSGLASVQPADVNLPPSWQPWPGESLTLSLIRPAAVRGETMVVESAELVFSPSNRASNSQLNLSIKTSQASQFDFPLPENASLDRVELNGSKLNLNPVKGVLRVPLQSGDQKLNIRWQTSEGISIKTSTPVLDFGVPTANQSISIRLPGDRWPLYLSGPSIGPSVLIWGILVVVLLLAFQLGKRHLTPLTSRDWILLALGIATVNLGILLLIAIWLMILQWRSGLNRVSSARRFKWMQLGLFVLSFIALSLLIAAIPQGLLSDPEMHIQGNGSHAYNLMWYQDMSGGELAAASVFSLPLWVYKLVMLCWSLWLAYSLIKWLAWGWKALGEKGFWYWTGEVDHLPKPKKS